MPHESAPTAARWTFHVTPEGAVWLLVAAGLVVLGAWKGINLILLLAYGLIALWVVNVGVAWRAPLRLTARRLDGGPLYAGVAAERVVEVSNPTPLPLAGGWVKETDGRCRLLWPAGRLEPGASVRLARPVCFPRRGRVAFGPLLVRGGFPFGLVRFNREAEGPADVVVLPALGRLHLGRFQRWLDRATRGDGRSRPRAQQLPVAEASIHGLRPYRRGDSPRLIHWRTSARRGELMVREFEEPLPHHDVVLVLDAGPAGPTAEAAVSAAATVCREWCQHRADHLTLAGVGGAGTGPDHARRLLEALAEWPDAPADAGALSAVTAGGRSPVLLVTATPDGPFADSLRARVGARLAVLDAARPPEFYTPPARPAREKGA